MTEPTRIDLGQPVPVEASAWWRGRRLRERAARLGLLEAPPFNDEKQRRAWEQGYQTALDDLAAGKLNESTGGNT